MKALILLIAATFLLTACGENSENRPPEGSEGPWAVNSLAETLERMNPSSRTNGDCGRFELERGKYVFSVVEIRRNGDMFNIDATADGIIETSANTRVNRDGLVAVSYTHLTLPTLLTCRSRW